MAELKTVEIFVTTDLRGRAKGAGRVMYILRTGLADGRSYESEPEAAEYEEATERTLVLYAVRDALSRMKYACQITVHTECEYFASVLSQGWLSRWQMNGWKNSRGKEVKDAELWEMLLQDLEEDGHILDAVAGKHEFVEWMRWNMQLATPYTGHFSKISEKPFINRG